MYSWIDDNPRKLLKKLRKPPQNFAWKESISNFHLPLLTSISSVFLFQLDDWVLCRVRQKSKVPQQLGGRNYSGSSCSPPFSRGYLQGQEMTIENANILHGHHQLPAQYQMSPLESEELDEKGQIMDLQEGSPEYSLSNSPKTIDSNVRNVLKSIERELSVGALDELLPSQPDKRLKVSASDNSPANASVFQISFPAPSASYQQHFSEF